MGNLFDSSMLSARINTISVQLVNARSDLSRARRRAEGARLNRVSGAACILIGLLTAALLGAVLFGVLMTVIGLIGWLIGAITFRRYSRQVEYLEHKVFSLEEDVLNLRLQRSVQ